LDKDLGDFLTYLDNKVGQGQYMVFLSADHGVAHVPAFMKENKLPGGNYDEAAFFEQMNQQLKDKYGQPDIISITSNYQVVLNNKLIAESKLNREEIIQWIINFLSNQTGVARVFEIDEMMETPLPAKVKEMMANGYYPPRGGDIQIILQPNWIEAFATGGTTHGSWNPYDSHIPLLWYGWGIKAGKTNRETYMTDIAPTLAALLKIQMPNGSIGKVINEVMK
jgi:arylsulfatase A-like enzyme